MLPSCRGSNDAFYVEKKKKKDPGLQDADGGATGGLCGAMDIRMRVASCEEGSETCRGIIGGRSRKKGVEGQGLWGDDGC